MVAQKGARLPAIRDLVKLGPAVAERAAFEQRPSESAVVSYVLTRGAQQAWEALNRQFGAATGALFWIGGPAGAGKTHFLNYTLALDQRAGALDSVAGRIMSLGLEAKRALGASDLEAEILDLLARQLAGNRRTAMLWRWMQGGEALTVGLDQAYGTGVRAVSLMIDFGAFDWLGASDYLETLAEVSATSKHPRLTVLAAGRGAPPQCAAAFDVAPADPQEELITAAGRARQLRSDAPSLASFYGGPELAGFEAAAIFPFHPSSLEVLAFMARPPGGVAAIARLMQEVLAPGADGRAVSYRRLTFPCDLMASAAFAKRVQSRLGEAGRAALKTAYASLADFNEGDRKIGARMIDSLVVNHLCAEAPSLTLDALAAAADPADHGGEPPPLSAWAPLLERIAARSKGTVRLEAGGASFNPLAAGALETAAFNSALALARLFDPTLSGAGEPAELQAQLKRLDDAMAGALESAHRTGEQLAELLLEWRAAPLAGPSLEDGEHPHGARPEAGSDAAWISRTLRDFNALAERGPAGLLELAAVPELRRGVIETVRRYESLARAAALMPRLRAMRCYLEATGLRAAREAGPAGAAALEVECQLLLAELRPALAFTSPRALEALEARYQKFKWSYAQSYVPAHDRWREEMEQLALLADDAGRHLAALARLNAIAALGPVVAAELEAALAALRDRIVNCDFKGPLATDVAPRCARCGFVLDTPSPRGDLEGAFASIDRALQVKLAALSRKAIARLIREHDRANRLEGFLKITQAAQTEALVRVLDDNLARYLAALLEESSAAAHSEAPWQTGAKPQLGRSLAAARPSQRNRGPAKPPR